MEKNLAPTDIAFYKNSRDDFLEVISNKFCKNCTKPQKAKMKINYTNPLLCECRCESVELLLTTAANLDAEIKKYTNND